MAGGGSEVRLLFCDGGDGAVTLELGITVINRHRPWACPKLAPHFQIGAGDCQLPEFLEDWRGEQSERGCWDLGLSLCLFLSA